MTDPVAARYQLHVCDGPSCGISYDGDGVAEALRAALAADGALAARVSVCRYTCFGRCDEGPNLFVEALAPGQPAGREPPFATLESQRGFYPGVDRPKALRILAEHCGRGCPVEAWITPY